MNSFELPATDDTFIDVPARNHKIGDSLLSTSAKTAGANLGFADGHAEFWDWKDPRTLTLTNPGGNPATPGNVDLIRLQQVARTW
jgi:prepilin-type processing-associated H-X9-DG protein